MLDVNSDSASVPYCARCAQWLDMPEPTARAYASRDAFGTSLAEHTSVEQAMREQTRWFIVGWGALVVARATLVALNIAMWLRLP